MSVKVINADVMDGLRQLADESVQCVVTSPPYWGLRDYGVEGQIGNERSLGEHIAKLIEVFGEVRRTMRPDATLWLNYGDAYNAYNGGAGPGSKLSGNQTKARPKLESGHGLKEKSFKAKDLLMMPERLAIALQDDGWYVRARIIWAKPNPMPESVTDRPTKSHEHIWLMSKQPRYYYDAEAIRESAVADNLASFDGGPQRGRDGSNVNDGRNFRIGAKGNANGFRGGLYVGGEPGPRTNTGNLKGRKAGNKNHKGVAQFEIGDEMHRTKAGLMKIADTEFLSRNCRDVWTIATAPFPDAHFATFPPELAERCIKAGSKPGDTILDPFGGAGTTGLVADRLQRSAILIELNPTYADMARARVSKDRGALLELMEPSP